MDDAVHEDEENGGREHLCLLRFRGGTAVRDGHQTLLQHAVDAEACEHAGDADGEVERRAVLPGVVLGRQVQRVASPQERVRAYGAPGLLEHSVPLIRGGPVRFAPGELIAPAVIASVGGSVALTRRVTHDPETREKIRRSSRNGVFATGCSMRSAVPEGFTPSFPSPRPPRMQRRPLGKTRRVRPAALAPRSNSGCARALRARAVSSALRVRESLKNNTPARTTILDDDDRPSRTAEPRIPRRVPVDHRSWVLRYTSHFDELRTKTDSRENSLIPWLSFVKDCGAILGAGCGHGFG